MANILLFYLHVLLMLAVALLAVLGESLAEIPLPMVARLLPPPLPESNSLVLSLGATTPPPPVSSSLLPFLRVFVRSLILLRVPLLPERSSSPILLLPPPPPPPLLSRSKTLLLLVVARREEEPPEVPEENLK